VRVRRRLSLVAGLAAFFLAAIGIRGTAQADGCEPPSGVSPCVDANSLWLPAGDARFLSIAPALPARREGFSFGLAVSFLDRPVRLLAPSPDPEGREINLVKDSLDAALLVAYGATQRLELTMAVPMALYQRGSGVQGFTSQSAPPLQTTAVRDPRLGAGLSVIEHRPLGFAGKARLEVSLPIGGEQNLAGGRTIAFAPGFAMELHRGRFRLGSEIGFRLRGVSEIAGTRVGSEATLALGVSFDVLRDSLLTVALESWMFPSLVSQARDMPDGTRARNVVLAPSEWLVSVRSVPLLGVAFQLGGGTALPLSSERRIFADGTSDVEYFAGVTSARWRLVLVARYALPDPS
jgi:OmpA-OmpF porin, OOP family